MLTPEQVDKIITGVFDLAKVVIGAAIGYAHRPLPTSTCFWEDPILQCLREAARQPSPDSASIAVD